MDQQPKGTPDLTVDDIAPVLGQMQLEIIALTKEVHRLQALVDEKNGQVRTE